MEKGSWEAGPQGDDALFDKGTAFERMVDELTVGGEIYGTIADVKKEHPELDLEMESIARSVAKAAKEIKEKGPSFFEEGGAGEEAFEEFVKNAVDRVYETLGNYKKEKKESEQRIDPDKPSTDVYFDQVLQSIERGFQEVKANAKKAFEMKDENGK